MNEKQNQFMMMVQTALLTMYATNEPGGPTKLQRACWSIEHMEWAFKVAETIPPDVSAADAAEAFMTMIIDRDRLTEDDKTILGILLNEPETT